MIPSLIGSRPSAAVAGLLAGMGSLKSLYANGENGFLFDDFSDLARQFTLFTGGTNVAADNDPVGLVLDNSKWGSGTLAQVLENQPALYALGGASLSGWSSSIGAMSLVGGRYRITSTGGVSAGRMTYPITCEVGKLYWVASERYAGTSLPSIAIALSAGAFGTNVGIAEGAGSDAMLFRATQTTHYVTLISNSSTDGFHAEFDNVIIKEVPGSHLLQATLGNRPFWKANSGKPYLLPDGANDHLISSFLPNAGGAGLTMALAGRIDNASTIMLGGGITTGDKRAYIGLDASGCFNIAWGTVSRENPAVLVDRRGVDCVVLVTGEGSNRDLWVNGVAVPLLNAASSAPDGTGGALALAAFNSGGTINSQAAGRIHAALALSRRVTPVEIALITTRLRSTYQ